MRLFEYIGLDEQFAGMFNQAMSESSTMIMNKVLEIYRGFNDVNTLVDVGGRLGTVLNLVIAKYPHIKGINFDLGVVLARAPLYRGTIVVDKYVKLYTEVFDFDNSLKTIVFILFNLY